MTLYVRLLVGQRSQACDPDADVGSPKGSGDPGFEIKCNECSPVPEAALASVYPVLLHFAESRQKVCEHCSQTSDQKDCIARGKVCMLTVGDESWQSCHLV